MEKGAGKVAQVSSYKKTLKYTEGF